MGQNAPVKWTKLLIASYMLDDLLHQFPVFIGFFMVSAFSMWFFGTPKIGLSLFVFKNQWLKHLMGRFPEFVLPRNDLYLYINCFYCSMFFPNKILRKWTEKLMISAFLGLDAPRLRATWISIAL